MVLGWKSPAPGSGARLTRPLVAFTIDVEGNSRVPVLLAANVLRVGPYDHHAMGESVGRPRPGAIPVEESPGSIGQGGC